ncbi:transposase [Gelidibacter pelagius]|uniref:Transposase IS200-like domain-containing protein n=1 Tax=Gelidibacter pelagius TaxID=2819985 RepID=A0ABS3SUS1_9FLAO|nr:transposase [Gelidibacter pelagius]MBO3099430.1 hypothetical protein [Gelidibacter pelagius]
MSKKFRNKYRIDSTRLQYWDYGSNAAYFVTICTKNRIHYFGDVTETQDIVSPPMQLSEIGKIADQNWRSIPEHFPFVKLGNHVIMPNHVHGIIIIDKPIGMDSAEVQTQNFASPPLQNFASPPLQKFESPPMQNTASPLEQQQKNKFGPQSKNLASIIRGYKASIKKYATMNSIDFAWQPLYHEHIIRSTQSYQRISNYILNNPMNWKKDTFHK